MDSDKSEEDEHEAISKQIVEYYKKFSLSQQLPKYFSGTSLSYMPKIVKDEEINKPVIIVEDTSQTTSAPKQSEFCQTDAEETAEPKVVSPASSVASVRKLEWDSGADIGYNNCNKSTKLQKSFSLPTLTGTSDQKIKEKSPKSKLSSHIVNVISYSSTYNHATDKTAPSSSSSSSYHPEVPVASSSSSSSAKPPSAKVSSSSSSSAGPPSAKPLSSSSSSTFANTLAYLKRKIGSPDAESTPRGVTNLKSTVISDETPFIPKDYKKYKRKVVELCVTKPISIECTEGKRKKKALDKRVQTSFVEKISRSVQTGDDTIDQLDAEKGPKENQSVIIISYGCENDKKTCSSNTQTDSEVLVSPAGDHQNNLRRTDAHSNLATSTDSSKEIPPLGQLISRKQSKSLVTDIDRSIELLQKLLKSKKYDSATKKRYIKKIVEKIVDNKYNEDSTTSSELFLPKKPDDKTQQKLQENIPWYPPKMSKFGVKTSTEEFLPEESKKKSLFTLSEAQYTATSCLDSLSSMEKPPNSFSGSCKSWKEEKTLSERLFEEKQNGEGDHLVNFAVKERQNQIEWINDEISHLIKLKDLLEQNPVHTTTTVYMLSQEYNNKPDSDSEKSGRNYVIQTEIPTSASEETLNKRISNHRGGRTSRKVSNLAGEFEVFSDEQTTNIRVKAKPSSRKSSSLSRKPTLIGPGKYDTYPRSKQEEQRCWPCGIMQVRKDRAEICRGTGGYTFEVPLSEDATAIIKKVDEIVSKYGSKSSTSSPKLSSGSTNSCLCKHKCDEKKSSIATFKDVTVQHSTTCPCKTKQKKDAVVEAVKFNDFGTTNVGTCTVGKTGEEAGTCFCKCECRKKEAKITCDKNVQCVLKCECKPKEISEISTQLVGEPETKELEKPGMKSTEENEHRNECICTEETASRSAGIQCRCLEVGATQTDACKCNERENNKEEPKIGAGSYTESLETSISSDTSGRTGFTSSDSFQSCICCKKKNVTAKHLYELRKRLSEEAYPLCRPCFRENRRCAYSYNTYTTPGHVCQCYTMVKTKTLDAIKKTIGDLEEMDYCSCAAGENGSNSSCCQYCRKKLKRTSKNRHGIAYLVTFENGTPDMEKKRTTPLEEIKIKIPAGRKKRHKEKENRRRKSSDEEGKREPDYTLQEYLNRNRPDFVETAEGRWKTVKESKSQREEVADQNKLKFLQNYQNTKEKNSKRLFSEKEMKEITRRNYRKLPEVQQRLVDNRKKQIIKANRLIADTFNRKLREKVLKGKRTLPTDVNVVNL